MCQCFKEQGLKSQNPSAEANTEAPLLMAMWDASCKKMISPGSPLFGKINCKNQPFLVGLQGWQSVTTVELSPKDSRWALKIIGPKLMVRRNVHLGRVHCQPWCTQSFIYSLQFKWALSWSTVAARLVVSKGYYRPAHKTRKWTLMGPQTSPWQQGRVGCWQLQQSKGLKCCEQNIIGSPISVEAQRLRTHGGVQGCSHNTAEHI